METKNQQKQPETKEKEQSQPVKDQDQVKDQEPAKAKDQDQAKDQVDPAVYNEYCELKHRQIEAKGMGKNLNANADKRIESLEKVVKAGKGTLPVKTRTIGGTNGQPVRMVEGIAVPDAVAVLIPKSETKYLK